MSGYVGKVVWPDCPARRFISVGVLAICITSVTACVYCISMSMSILARVEGFRLVIAHLQSDKWYQRQGFTGTSNEQVHFT